MAFGSLDSPLGGNDIGGILPKKVTYFTQRKWYKDTFLFGVYTANRLEKFEVFYREKGSAEAEGLYDPQWEHASCGVGAVVPISGRREHRIIEYANQVLLNFPHRGADGADKTTGLGAGHLVSITSSLLCRRGQTVEDRFAAGGTICGAQALSAPAGESTTREKLRRECPTILCQTVAIHGERGTHYGARRFEKAACWLVVEAVHRWFQSHSARQQERYL